MEISFEGIGQWAATFACGEDLTEGQVVKITGNGTVGTCADGDDFCGAAMAVDDDGICAVVMGGMVTVPCSGGAPALGWSCLSADGAGGVKAGSAGQKYRVVDVDTAGKMLTFVL